MSSIDRVQTMFLEELGIAEDLAMLEFHLAPLSARRDIAILGLLHKVAMRKGPSSLQELFPLGGSHFPRSLLAPSVGHDHQLHDAIDGCQSAAVGRSAFGMIHVYNLLPKDVVEGASIKTFQRKLQLGLKRACRAGLPDWPDLFKVGLRNLSVSGFQQMFSGTTH